MDYSSLSPEKVQVSDVSAWRLSWPDGRRIRSATFRTKREALDFRDELNDLGGSDPRLAPHGRWVCDGELTTPALRRMTALTVADLERIHAQRPRERYDDLSLARLVVFSVESGVETITLARAKELVTGGRLFLLLAVLDDVPTDFLTAWARSQPPARPTAGDDGHPEQPVTKLHRERDSTEIDRILAEGYLAEDSYRPFTPATMRMIAVARGIPDLRHLPADSGEFNGYVNWHLVSAAVLTDLDLDMFRPDNRSESKEWDWRWDGVRGLPVGPLAEMQVYGSNLDGRWQGRSHTVRCQHRPERHEGRFNDDDQMMPLWLYLRTSSSDDLCSKCGGRSVRRPTALQFAYYSDMEELVGVLRVASDASRGRISHALGEEKRAEIAATLRRIEDAWCNRYPDPLDPADKQRLLHLIAQARAHTADDGARTVVKGGASVLRFPKAPEPYAP